MESQELMGAAVRLGASVDALAALAAFVRLETEHLPADPAVRDLLAKIAAEIAGGDGTIGDGAADTAAAAPVIGLARAFLRQAAELIENPGRSGGWDQVDIPLLQSMGRMSMGISGAVLAAEKHLPGLAEGMTSADAVFVDVGTGTGWLAIAIAQSHPNLTVVGIDIFEPALELARANVRDVGLDGRVHLRQQDATLLEAGAGYDAIWLPLPFITGPAVPSIIDAAVRALRPGGWLLPGTFTGPSDKLSELLTDLRTVRSGGHPWKPAEIADLLIAGGLVDSQEIPRSWAAPVRLYAARRP